MNYNLNSLNTTTMDYQKSKTTPIKILLALLSLFCFICPNVYADGLNFFKESVLAQNDTAKYSVFDINAVAHRSKAEIAELYSATGQDLFTVIALNPQRLLLHEVIVQTITKWKSNDDNEIIDKTLLAYKDIAKSAEAQKVFNEAFKYRLNLNNSTLDSLKALGLNIKIKNDYKPGKFVDGYDQNKALSALIIDRAYTKYATQEIAKLVTNYYDGEFRFNPKAKIDSNQSARPYVLLLSDISTDSIGIQSVFPRFVKLKFEQNSIAWPNVVKVSSNIFYTLLYLNKKIIVNPLNESFMLPEKEMLKNKLMAKMQELYIKRDIQYVFWKDLMIEPRMLNLGLNNNGVVSVEVITNENFKQFNSRLYKGSKYKFTNKILDAYNAMILNLPNMLVNYSGKNVYFTLFEITNKDNALAKVLEVFNAQRYVKVSDSQKMANFVTIAKDNNQIQSAQNAKDSTQVKDYLMPFISRGYTIPN